MLESNDDTYRETENESVAIEMPAVESSMNVSNTGNNRHQSEVQQGSYDELWNESHALLEQLKEFAETKGEIVFGFLVSVINKSWDTLRALWEQIRNDPEAHGRLVKIGKQTFKVLCKLAQILQPTVRNRIGRFMHWINLMIRRQPETVNYDSEEIMIVQGVRDVENNINSPSEEQALEWEEKDRRNDSSVRGDPGTSRRANLFDKIKND